MDAVEDVAVNVVLERIDLQRLLRNYTLSSDQNEINGLNPNHCSLRPNRDKVLFLNPNVWRRKSAKNNKIEIINPRITTTIALGEYVNLLDSDVIIDRHATLCVSCDPNPASDKIRHRPSYATVCVKLIDLPRRVCGSGGCCAV